MGLSAFQANWPGLVPSGTALKSRDMKVARLTGLEPATPGVTGRYSNQLSYNRSLPDQHRC